MFNLSAREIEKARERIQSVVLETELDFSPEISARLKTRLYLKWENHQPTGSFKIRGAANKILANLDDCRERGVIAASTGNHGLATACICQKERLSLSLFVPESISEVKRRKLQTSGATLTVVDGPCEKAEALARQVAARARKVFVSPYNDEQVIAGQGTCGLEILSALPEVEEVVVPVGGGGLISGIAVYLKEKKPGIKITGVEPENSAFIKHSLEKGQLSNGFPEKPTLADAVAGGLEEGAITFDLIKKYVDRVVTVTEDELARAVRWLYRYHGEKVEGAGALSLAALIAKPELFTGRHLVAVVSGGNIQDDLWQSIVSGERIP
ncbi:MAG: threonine ammonia-lyase [Candidatus Saccharicenans sp.]